MSPKLESFSLCNFLIQVIDKSFGFDTAVEEAQRAINAAHVEAESVENGIGVVKLMGRYSGKFCISGLFTSSYQFKSYTLRYWLLSRNKKMFI